MYGNAATYVDSPTTGGQDHFLDSLFLSSVKNDVDAVIDFLNFRQQRVNYVAETTKELIHWRQSMMAKPNIDNSVTLPTPDGGTFLPFTELGFGGGGLDAFQYHLSQGGMENFHHADALDASRSPVSMKISGQYQASAALSHNMTEIGDERLPREEVARYHGNGTFTPPHATPSQSINLYYGHTPETRFDSARSCFPGQALSHATITYPSDNRDGHVRISGVRNKTGGPNVLSFMSGSIKHYRCECGYGSARKRDMDHHLESLQHSGRKYECSCGKKFTRYDSLHRHRKRKMQKSKGPRA